MNKKFSDVAFEEYLYWQENKKTFFKKINALIKSIERDGALKGEGQPEKLKYLNDTYSRRIDKANRLVYQIVENTIVIKSCKGHYDD